MLALLDDLRVGAEAEEEAEEGEGEVEAEKGCDLSSPRGKMGRDVPSQPIILVGD
jgi:hypothetical protein